MTPTSLAWLAKFFEVEDIPFVQNPEGGLDLSVTGEEYCTHEITFTETYYGWLRANVWTKQTGLKRVHNLGSLCREVGDRFGHRVHIIFVGECFSIYTFIRPDRAAEEIKDFVYACDKLVPLLINMEKVEEVGVWNDAIMNAAFLDIEGRA